MTKPLRKAVAIIAEVTGPKKRVLEIGSRQEKNQNQLANVRGMFGETEYVGVDMRPGPGVDQVCNAEKLPFKNASFDLVLCLEVLEHAEKPWLVADEVVRVLKRDGVAIISSQQNFPIHNHPSDYFRYTPFGMRSLFKKLASNVVFGIGEGFDDLVSKNPEHVILVGSKGNKLDIRKLVRQMTINETKISGHKPYRHRLQMIIKLSKRIVWEIRFRLSVVVFK